MSVLSSLDIPIIIAPMAGGPSTPAMVNAAAHTGTLGFLAGGTATSAQLGEELSQTKGMVGVNLFRPQQHVPKLSEVEAFVSAIEPLYAQYGLAVPAIEQPDLKFGWSEKIELLLASPPAVVSSTFGIFSASEIAQFKSAGCEVWVTVTGAESAAIAERAGADALIVQGVEAGGHRSTWDVRNTPNSHSVHDLLRLIDVDIPLVAAGGIMSRDDVAKVLAAGASAAWCGSAFLLADEAGTSQFNRDILADRGSTVVSRAFSGRYARGAATRFTLSAKSLPPLYPHLNYLLAPLREASQAQGIRDFSYCLVGAGNADIRTGSVQEILHYLNPEV